MKYKEKILNNLIIIFGNILIACGTALFVLPFSIDCGGLSGVSVVLKKFFDPVLVITILNWILFALGFIFLKKEFALKTLLSTIAYPLLLNVLYRSNLANIVVNETADPLLGAIFSGLLYGIGMGLIFKVGGSSGGLDVITAILHKYKGIKMSTTTFCMDFIIVITGLFAVSMSASLYGVISIVITSYLIEVITIRGNASYMMHIISNKSNEINEYIINDLSRGSTIIASRGGMNNEDKDMIEVIFNEKEYFTIKRNIERIDKDAFISVYKAVNVYGNGFNKLSKK